MMDDDRTNLKLLLVDDEEDFRRATMRVLDRRGFTVIEAASGEDALAAIKQERPDIVLLDLKMPGMSGIETLQHIRETAPDLPVVILTGHGDFDAALAGIRLQIVDFIQKPVDVDQLSERIRRLRKRDVSDLMREPTVAELMAPPDLYPKVCTDEPLTSVLKAISGGYQRPIPADSAYGQVRSALVYDREGEFKGIIRFSDLLQLLIPDALADSPYASFFTGMLLAQSKVFGRKTIGGLVPEQVFMDVDTPLMEAVHLLVEHKLINIPVTRHGGLVGILRARDIIIATARLAGVEL